MTEFAEWLIAKRSRKSEQSSSSIAIFSPCLVCQPRVAESLSKYLNEFDSDSDGASWLFLNDKLTREVKDSGHDPVEMLQTHGNLVIESTEIVADDISSESVFKVYLSCKEPAENGHHLWLNAKSIAPETLTLMIASSFMEWVERDVEWASSHKSPVA